MDVQNTARFDQAAATLTRSLRDILLAVPDSAKRTALEIRLRAGYPIALTCPEQIWFLGRGSELHNLPQGGYGVTKNDLADSLISMCAHSIHSHQHEIRNGFVSLLGGHRAGICGTAVLSGREITAIRDITSINIRIAREIQGAATTLVESVLRKSLCGILVAGPPSSGKTTLLRDLARQLSSGKAGRFIKVAVVDERCEIGAVHEGVPQNNLGPGCDILSGYPKGEGILMAVRTLSPQVIICDEIGKDEEADEILCGLNCGVKVIASAHGDSVGELCRRKPIRKLLEQGAFDRIVLLDGSGIPGCIREVLEVGDVLGEADGNAAGYSVYHHDRNVHGFRFIQAGVHD